MNLIFNNHVATYFTGADVHPNPVLKIVLVLRHERAFTPFQETHYSSGAFLLLKNYRSRRLIVVAEECIQIAALDFEAGTTEVGAELQQVKQKQFYFLEFPPPLQGGKVNDNILLQLNPRSQVSSCLAFLLVHHCQRVFSLPPPCFEGGTTALLLVIPAPASERQSE
jgi:hypothetical protein